MLTQGDVRQVLRALAVITVTVESAGRPDARRPALVALRRSRWAQAAWLGIFHSISAFNNAGFALASDSLISYGQDPLILGPIGLAIIIGGLGFLVVLELYRRATGAAQPGAPTPVARR